jgi:transcriptional regulator with XRE-family HTH domain
MAKRRMDSAVRSPPQSNNFRAWRKYRRLTQEQLSAKANIATSSVSDLENDKQRYGQVTLEALAAALETHPGLILLGPPNDEAEAWLILRGLSTEERSRALDVLRAFARPARHAAE